MEGETLRTTEGGVMERYFTGVLVLRFTGEGDAVLGVAGDTCCVATLLELQEGVGRDAAPYVFARLGISIVHEQIEPSSPNL